MRVSTCHERAQSTGAYASERSMGHTNEATTHLFLSSFSRRTTTSYPWGAGWDEIHIVSPAKDWVLAVVAEPLGDHFQEHFACMSHQRDVMVVAALCFFLWSTLIMASFHL